MCYRITTGISSRQIHITDGKNLEGREVESVSKGNTLSLDGDNKSC